MPQAVTISSLPRAFELVKGMQAQGLEWGEGYRPGAVFGCGSGFHLRRTPVGCRRTL